MVRTENAYYSDTGSKITEKEAWELANTIINKFAEKKLSVEQARVVIERAYFLCKANSQILVRDSTAKKE